MTSKRTICIIPVRGGSKGISRKNLSEIKNGISLLEWTIRQALRVYPQQDVYVSTEDGEMTDVARSCGAQVIARPKELATDESTSVSVVEHLLESVDPNADMFALITLLQVTSPLRTDDDVLLAKNKIESGQYDSVVSAFEDKISHPAKMYFLDSDRAIPVAPKYESMRRQDLPKVVQRNGAIFSVTRSFFEHEGRLWGGRTAIVEMPRERSIDIDAPIDLETARSYLGLD
ncbi:acylneuraminate cytidylyltransferase family protein [Solemya velum gill symbiont]|uniref:acylneuraminate cytidylyltransferase family protein n=1 Tax=Solemya velum gill symbiont TaxID=2340 RepID=UPI000998C40B|nr:acylneuraminate cytidylyltransferase family protein [Solemya velum gill symbiont]OOY99066.1 hypothetical protein BOW19_06300 [Solemya velum gill symbiont]OOZ01330.1 hypothetical protein BOW20_05960 [Solemya velum gill symbiont]OOZ03551.1 hypothetical protein BOW21_06330 [Solemya velum gill symbiont]OOZ05743.1 hypothetical protein BOW22_05970 [Solemya velum gill symbiont]OOZ07961.1 hypothetical protein BOW23_05970 [Solemya velum gill symbiont]